MRRAGDEVTRRFASSPQPVLLALTGALLAGNLTATALLGQRNRAPPGLFLASPWARDTTLV